MTLRHIDPFIDPTIGLNAIVNPYVAALRDETTLPLSYGPGLRDKAGTWHDTFANQGRPLNAHVVEIGCHLGRTINEMANDYADVGFIGIDITFKRVVSTARRAKIAGRSNVHAVLANAVTIDQLFGPEELDGVVIFFPDPWVKKKRQAKNRLISSDFAAKLLPLIKPGGFCWFKTDQKSYLDDGVRALTSAGLVSDLCRAKSAASNASVTSLPARQYESTFESGFKRQGLPTYEDCLWK